MHSKNRVRSMVPRGGFTLVELLVVISIIGTLMALLLPAVQAARETGRATTCRNNLKQLSLAVHSFENSTRQYPGFVSELNGVPRSWTFVLLPYLERNDVYKHYSLETLAGESLAQQPEQRLDFMECPSDSQLGSTNEPPSSYVVNTGCPDALASACAPATLPDWPGNGVFHDLRPQLYEGGDPIPTVGMTVAYINTGDGLTNTLMLSENVDVRSWVLLGNGDGITSLYERQVGFVWFDGVTGDPPVTDPPPESKINRNLGEDIGMLSMTFARPGSYHPGNVNVAFCDGRVQSLSEAIDYLVYCLLMSTNGRSLQTPGRLTTVHPIFSETLLDDADY